MNQQQYEQWLSQRSSYIKAMYDAIDEKLAHLLNFTPQSLRFLARYLTDNFSDLNVLHLEKNRKIHWGASTYAFEVFRINLNMTAKLPLDDIHYQYYGMPVLHIGNGPDVCPFDLVTFTVHRRDNSLLYNVYCNQTNAQLIDFEFFRMTENKFNEWLTFITDQLDTFFSSLNETLSFKLDFSVESLEIVSEILNLHKKNHSFLPDNEHILNLMTYVGEVFQRNCACVYTLPSNVEDDFYQLPCLKKQDGVCISLLHLVLDALNSEISETLFHQFDAFSQLEKR